MKKINDYLGLAIETEISNPKFKEITIKGDIDGIEQERQVTLCQLTAKTNILRIAFNVRIAFNSTIGISIRNPEDIDNELGKQIAYGRAIKNPITSINLRSNRKLPKPIIDEQLVWAEKHVERNLNNYVNNLRETLKNG